MATLEHGTTTIGYAVEGTGTPCTSLCGWATTDARMRFTFDLWRRLIAVDAALFMRYAVADGFTAGAIASPTLVIGGQEDRWVDVSHSHTVASAVTGATLQVLSQGHLVIQEGAAEVATLLHQHASQA